MYGIQKAFMSFKALEISRIKAENEEREKKFEEERRQQQEAEHRREKEIRRSSSIRLQLMSPVPTPEYEVIIGTFNVVVRQMVLR